MASGSVRLGMMKPTVLLTIVLVLAACSGSDQAPTAPLPGSSVSTVIPPGQQVPTEPSPSPVEPTPGLQGVRPVPWDEAIVGDDDRTITLTFYTGIPECYGLDRADVAYGQEEVTITRYEGTVPGAQACIEIAVFASTTVMLDEPLDGRDIIDGAKGDDPAT